MVPKCASSTINSYCNYLKFRRIRPNTDLSKPKPGTVFDLNAFLSGTTYLGVIRDPVDRWVSGMAQAFYLKEAVAERLATDIGPFIEDPWFDQHQAPQAWFYRNIDNPVLYKIENLEELMEWVCHEIGVDFPEITNENVTSQEEQKQELHNAIKRQMTSEYEAALRLFYADDSEMYRKAA
jgi:hypothetical protein